MNINDTYIDFVGNIIKHGDNVIKDDGDKIIELLGNHYFIDNPLNDMVLFSSDDHLLQCIKKGMFDVPGNPINSMALYNYVSEGFEEYNKHDFVYTYPNRLLHHFTVKPHNQGWLSRILFSGDEASYINEFDEMAWRLRNSPGSNRAVSVIYDPAVDTGKKDIPCLNWLQFTIRHDKLTLHCMFRSNDIFTAFYSNMYLLTYWGLKMTTALQWGKEGYKDLKFVGIDYHSSSGHIYEDAIDEAKYMLSCNK